MPTIYVRKSTLKRLDNAIISYCKQRHIGNSIRDSINHDKIINEVLDELE